MSTGCSIVASKTAPVEEVIKHNENGLLVDFYDIDGFVEQINYLLDNPQENLRKNARQTIIDNYDLKKLLPKHIEVLKNLAK